jgi:hypothetical protein
LGGGRRPHTASLKSAYPEGVYVFSGTAVSGAKLHGRATLSHRLPATVSFLRPGPGTEQVDITGVVTAWTPAPRAAGYIVYVEQDELNVSLTARLPGSATRFAVRDGFLAPATEYLMGIGAVTEEGNVSYVEAPFTTAARK